MSLAELHAVAYGGVNQSHQRVFPLADPAAGVDWSFTVPGGKAWEILSINATLTASDADGNRSPTFTISDGTNIVATVVSGAQQSSNTTLAMSLVRGWNEEVQSGAAASYTTQWPTIALPTGWTVTVVTEALDVADQWSQITVAVIEQKTGPVIRELVTEEAIAVHAEALYELTHGGA